jgi:hypothetical protein
LNESVGFLVLLIDFAGPAGRATSPSSLIAAGGKVFVSSVTRKIKRMCSQSRQIHFDD